MIALVRNGKVLQVENSAPLVWTDPDTGVSYSNYAALPVADMIADGWRQVTDDPPAYDPVYETRTPGDWYYDAGQDVVTRNYTVADRPLEEVRAERLAAVRLECRTRITTVIDIHHQLDVALGLIPNLGYSTWIAAMITESNRCEDIYDAAATMADMRAVVWNFPVYGGE